MNRQEAYNNKLKFYNEGKTCSRGHNSDRYVSTGNCVECHKKYSESKKHDVKKFGTKSILRLLDMVVVTYRVASEDKDALDAYAAALNFERTVLKDEALRLSLTKPTLA